MQKVANLEQKNKFFQLAPKHWWSVFGVFFLGNKTVHQRFGANSKCLFFYMILNQISAFF